MVEKTVFSISLWDVYQKEGREALERGDLEGAAERFQAALEKAESHGDKDPRIATTKRCLGNVLHKLGRLDEAEKYYKNAIELLEKQLGPDSIALIKVLICQKALLGEAGRKDEMKAVNERIKKIREHSHETFGTTDIFEEELPPNPEKVPMSTEQAMRIQELISREEISDATRTETETLMLDNPSYLWAHETQGKLRKEIVDSFKPKFD